MHIFPLFQYISMFHYSLLLLFSSAFFVAFSSFSFNVRCFCHIFSILTFLLSFYRALLSWNSIAIDSIFFHYLIIRCCFDFEMQVVIQYDKDLLEVWDEAKRLRCEWFNDYEKTASKPPMVIADLDVIQLDFRGKCNKFFKSWYFCVLLLD